MVTERLLTRSMLIKMYLPLHGMWLYVYIVFTVSQFHADAHSVYLVFQIAYMFCLTQQFYQTCDVNHLYSRLLPHPTEAPHEIWLHSA